MFTVALVGWAVAVRVLTTLPAAFLILTVRSTVGLRASVAVTFRVAFLPFFTLAARPEVVGPWVSIMTWLVGTPLVALPATSVAPGTRVWSPSVEMTKKGPSYQTPSIVQPRLATPEPSGPSEAVTKTATGVLCQELSAP